VERLPPFEERAMDVRVWGRRDRSRLRKGCVPEPPRFFVVMEGVSSSILTLVGERLSGGFFYIHPTLMIWDTGWGCCQQWRAGAGAGAGTGWYHGR